MQDLALTPTGDLVPNWLGGLVTVNGIACDQQDIAYRAQTNDPDQQLYNIGCNLDDLIGLPNSQATANVGIVNIENALTTDGRFSATNLTIDGFPLDLQTIQFDIYLQESTVRSTAPIYTTAVNLGS
jgi:hypothetical protein